MAWESDSSSQLVGSAPQQVGRTSGVGERTEARPVASAGAARPHGRLPRTQCTTAGGGGSPPSSPDRGAKKLEVGQPACTCHYTPSSEVYRDKHKRYVVPTGQVAALEEEGSALSEQATGEDSESEVEAVGGINVCLAQAMSRYQWEEWQCFVCGSPGHFTRGCPHREAFRQ